MRAFNLLPTPRVEQRQDGVQSRLQTTNGIAAAASAVLVLLAVLIGFAFVQGRSNVSDRRTTLDRLETQVARQQAAASVSAAVAAQAQAHLAAFTAASAGRAAYDNLLDQLGRVMPRGAWLDTLQLTPGAASTTTTPTTESTGSAVVTSNGLSSSGAAVAPAATTLTVNGFALTQDTVARVLDRLALIPALSDVSLQSTQRADVAGKKAMQFTIVANVRTTGGNG
jgi:Tfp pilus assembly protein PilN